MLRNENRLRQADEERQDDADAEAEDRLFN